MPYIIDARREGGDIVFLGKSITFPKDNSPVNPDAPPLVGSVRFNPVSQALELFHQLPDATYAWDALVFLSQVHLEGVASINVIGENGVTATGGPITTSGTITLSLASPSGLVAAQYHNPTITVNAYGIVTAISEGTLPTFNAVTSVALTSDANFTISGSPVTSSGTINVALNTTGVIPTTTGSPATVQYSNATLTVDAYGRVVAAADGVAPIGGSPGVSSVTITSTDLLVTNGHLTANGTIDIELKDISPSIAPGPYTFPNVTVDAKGRITQISSGVNTGFATPEQYYHTVDGTDYYPAFVRMAADPTVSLIKLGANYPVSMPVSFPQGAMVFGGGLGAISPVSPNTLAISHTISNDTTTKTILDNVLINGGVYVASDSVAVTGGYQSAKAGFILDSCTVNGAVVFLGENHVVKNSTINGTANGSGSVAIPSSLPAGPLSGLTVNGGIWASLTGPIRIFRNAINGAATTGQPTSTFSNGIYIDASVATANPSAYIEGNRVQGYQTPIYTNVCDSMIIKNIISYHTLSAIVVYGTVAKFLAGIQINGNIANLNFQPIVEYPPVILLGAPVSTAPPSNYVCQEAMITNNIVQNTLPSTMVGYNGVASIVCGFNRFGFAAGSSPTAAFGVVVSGTPEVF